MALNRTKQEKIIKISQLSQKQARSAIDYIIAEYGITKKEALYLNHIKNHLHLAENQGTHQ